MYLLIALLVAMRAGLHESTLLGNFSQGPPIYGVGVIDDNIYVIKEMQQAINVYRTDTYSLKLNASLPLVSGPYDMVSSASLDSLFLLDWFRSEDVIRVNLYRKFDSDVSKFTSEFTSAALSMAQGKKLIVTKSSSASFDVYGATGKLAESVKLKNISAPRQVIQVSVGKYAVCFGYYENETHGVCTVDGKGNTLKCFKGPPGNGTTQLNVPARMLLLDSGAILVADMLNSRIVELSKDLTSMRVLFSKNDGLARPYRMFLEVGKKRLYVANNDIDPVTKYAVSGNVLVFRYR